MSTAEDTWRRKSDEEIEEAASRLGDFTDLGKRIVLAEVQQRNLEVNPDAVTNRSLQQNAIWRQNFYWISCGSVSWVASIVIIWVLVGVFGRFSDLITLNVLTIVVTAGALLRWFRTEVVSDRRAEMARRFLLGVWMGPVGIVVVAIVWVAGLQWVLGERGVRAILALLLVIPTWVISTYLANLGWLIGVTMCIAFVIIHGRVRRTSTV